MTNKISLLFVAASLLSLPAHAAVKNSHPGRGSVVVMGDSLANGKGSDENSLGAPASCLERLTQTPVTQLARNGATSQEILTQLPQALQARVVFVSSGGNDSITEILNPGGYPADKSLKEMDDLFTQLLDTGALVIYLGLKPPFSGAERMAEIWKLAEAKGVLVIDGLTDLWDDESKMSDLIHPNEAGYREICEKISKEISAHYP